MSFRLFTEETNYWSFADYQAVLDVMRETQAQTVLEFGPGSSTLALLEGGATAIHTCETVDDWAAVWDERLVARFHPVVSQHRYTYQWPVPLSIPPLDGRTFDLGLIDGPGITAHRPLAIRYALTRCQTVVVPTEDAAPVPSYLRPILALLAEEFAVHLAVRDTGPFAGGFAVLTRP